MAGEIRARDVREQLKGIVDPKLSHILENLAEQQFHLAKGMTQATMLVEQMADMLPGMMQVAQNMKDVIEKGKNPDDGLESTLPQ